MSIFQNGIDSINIGVKDFETEEKVRLTSSVRNIYAGVLLLCKEALRRIDENLIYSKIN